MASVPIYLTQWIGQLCADGDAIYALRVQPEQGGRGVVTRIHDDGRAEPVTPPPFSARTRVYESGGPAFAVLAGVVYFSNVPDDRLYRQPTGGQPQPITAAGAMRYGDLSLDRQRRRILCVREDRTAAGESKHTIAAVSMDGAGDSFGTVLFDQTDFVSTPCLSPDGRRLAWFAWNHPHMRFYTSGVWLADVNDDGLLTNVREIVPEADESILSLEWSPDGDLIFCSDRSNWWNLYRWRDGDITPLAPIEAEMDRPFRAARVGSASHILGIYRRLGVRRVGLFDTESGSLRELPLDYTYFAAPAVTPDAAYVVAASPTEPLCLLRIDLLSGQVRAILRSSERIGLDGYISAPTQIEFPTENGLTAHAVYYAPANRDYAAPVDERPPLIVEVHGGPTSSASVGFNLGIQFWTSRGFAYLDVDYGGSTGYGRAYRQRLWGQWGVVDVDDAINAARCLIAQGLADPNRTIVRGGSAGGFTTFAALAFRDFFAAGSSHFGISDLEVFHKETHKYESHYCETLVGAYPAQRDLYRRRSPIDSADAIRAPLILFQGMDDKIVPPNQSQFVANAVRRRGIPTAYLEFEGESHGFRRYETNVRTHQAELTFFSTVFGFQPADALPPLAIDNLTALSQPD
ncbi:MAG: S9 family peptidase [Anaerolineae bacterium]|nr:S9 family peptidase [Anaerolineae bacterium]